MPKLEYHFCFIGPFDRHTLDQIRPRGEGSIRSANQQAYRKLTNSAEDTCASGWGVSPKQVDEARFFLTDDNMKDQIIQSYYDEDKPLPTNAHRAWEALRKTQGKTFQTP